MMGKMQLKIKDSNLRSIDSFKVSSKGQLEIMGNILEDEEERKVGSPGLNLRRNRNNSILGLESGKISSGSP